MLITELKLARISSGWSQRVLADRIGAHSQVVKRMEKGVGSVATVVAVMDALDFRLAGLGAGRTLGEKLRARRKARSWSMGELAARTGLTRSTIAALERDRGSISSLVRSLAVIAPNVRRRAEERSYWGEGDKLDRDCRFTPVAFMDAIYHAFGDVDLDPCAHELSPVTARRRIMLSDGGDGLADRWSGRLAYVNPPFSELLVWLRRAHEQWKAGNVDTVVCLVPVRTDSRLFQETLSVDADIHLLRGRIQFIDPRGRVQPTPFSLMLMTFGATSQQKARFAELELGYWLEKRQLATSKSGCEGADRETAPDDAPPRLEVEVVLHRAGQRSPRAGQS